MAGNKGIRLALCWLWITRQSAEAAQCLHCCVSAGEDLVGITLMPHVKYQAVQAGIKDSMNGNDQLHRTQTGRQMAPGMRDHIQNAGPQQTAQGHSLAVSQAAEIVGTLLQTKNGNTSR